MKNFFRAISASALVIFGIGLMSPVFATEFIYQKGQTLPTEKFEDHIVSPMLSVAAEFTSKQGLITVYRVEGPMNMRVMITEAGNAIIQDAPFAKRPTMLYLNFGNKERALEFLENRLSQFPRTTVKTFGVQESFLKELQSIAVDQSQAKLFPGRPIIVDPTMTKNVDQFGIPAQWQAKVQREIIPGTGRELTQAELMTLEHENPSLLMRIGARLEELFPKAAKTISTMSEGLGVIAKFATIPLSILGVVFGTIQAVGSGMALASLYQQSGLSGLFSRKGASLGLDTISGGTAAVSSAIILGIALGFAAPAALTVAGVLGTISIATWAGSLVVEHWDTITSYTNAFGAGVARVAKTAVKGVAEGISSAAHTTVQLVQAGVKLVKDTVTTVGNAVSNGWNSFWGWVTK